MDEYCEPRQEQPLIVSSAVMIAESVSLGVLSLPQTLAQLGLAPAIVLIITLGILATYTGYVIGQFHQRYPHIQNLADAGEVLLGPFGRELFGIGQLLFSIFIMGSHILTFSVMMNTVTDHGTCTMVYTTVGFVICMVCSLPRSMKNMTYISCFCQYYHQSSIDIETNANQPSPVS